VIDAATPQLVQRRAHQCCEYCRLPQPAASYFSFHVEYIRARQHGGSDDPLNLCLACPDCNSVKEPNLAAIDPQTDTLVPLFHPRTDAWASRFAWRGAVIVGRTPQGRATANLLRFNDPDRVRMREELQVRGEL
jgi:hypothetical protein